MLVAVVGATVVVACSTWPRGPTCRCVGPLPAGSAVVRGARRSTPATWPRSRSARSASRSSRSPTPASCRGPSPLRAGYQVDPNQEMVALGAANIATGFFQGFPISSSSSQHAGGRAGRRQDPAHRARRRRGDRPDAGVRCPTWSQNLPSAALAAVVIAAALEPGRGRRRPQAVAHAQDRVRALDRLLPRRGVPRRDRGHLHRRRRWPCSTSSGGPGGPTTPCSAGSTA